ncbi:MAG: type I 3-dehydroquinate dehydratase [Clostridia bacterium]|nr:type I 3-dehydroquinate dehydratase [Clostridia bacterium]
MTRQSLAHLPAPALAGVVREQTEAAAKAEIKNCLSDGADMIDLHLSCLEQDDVETLGRIMEFSGLPILALHYNRTYDWSDAGADEEERVASLLRAVEAGAAGIDMQGYTFDVEARDGFHGEIIRDFMKKNPKEVVTDPAVIAKQMALIDKVHSMGGEVLLSCHPGITMTAEEVVELALFLAERKPDIIKIVTVAKTEEDLVESFKAMLMLKKQVPIPVAYHANGRAGVLSRTLNPAVGGQIAFCVDHFNAGSTMEQIDLRTARTAVDALKRLM